MNNFKYTASDTEIFVTSMLMCFALIFSMESAIAGLHEKVGLIEKGNSQNKVFEFLGEPARIVDVERYIYPKEGRVIVINEKVSDIRLIQSESNNSPLWQNDNNRHKKENVNMLKLLRIGYPVEKITEIAGEPEKIEYGKDLHYANGEVVIELENNRVTTVNKNIETGLARLDWVKLNFSPTALLIMNITIAFIMFGVAMEIKPESFKQVLKEPKSLILGIFSQFIALPALTFLMILFIQPTATVALGMILVASCPGGNVSNFMSSVAKGNIALSVSLTAFATISAVFMTPVNFAFWGNLYSETSNMVIPIRIDFLEILRTVLLLLGVPVVLGIWFSKTFPELTNRIVNPVKKLSMVIFLLFIVMAFAGNINFFMSYIHLIVFIVLAHNALALLTGFTIGTLGKVSRADRRSLSIETGIQNSGLGLVIIFNPRLFDGLGGMAFIAAWWGIWHIISGLTISWFWSKKILKEEKLQPRKVSTYE